MEKIAFLGTAEHDSRVDRGPGHVERRHITDGRQGPPAIPANVSSAHSLAATATLADVVDVMVSRTSSDVRTLAHLAGVEKSMRGLLATHLPTIAQRIDALLARGGLQTHRTIEMLAGVVLRGPSQAPDHFRCALNALCSYLARPQPSSVYLSQTVAIASLMATFKSIAPGEQDRILSSLRNLLLNSPFLQYPRIVFHKLITSHHPRVVSILRERAKIFLAARDVDFRDISIREGICMGDLCHSIHGYQFDLRLRNHPAVPGPENFERDLQTLASEVGHAYETYMTYLQIDSQVKYDEWAKDDRESCHCARLEAILSLFPAPTSEAGLVADLRGPREFSRSAIESKGFVEEEDRKTFAELHDSVSAPLPQLSGVESVADRDSSAADTDGADRYLTPLSSAHLHGLAVACGRIYKALNDSLNRTRRNNCTEAQKQKIRLKFVEKVIRRMQLGSYSPESCGSFADVSIKKMFFPEGVACRWVEDGWLNVENGLLHPSGEHLEVMAGQFERVVVGTRA